MGERAESMEARIDAIVEWIRHFEEVHWHPTYEKQIDVLIDRNLRKCPTRKEPPMAPGSEKGLSKERRVLTDYERKSVRDKAEKGEPLWGNGTIVLLDCVESAESHISHLESLLAVAVAERDEAIERANLAEAQRDLAQAALDRMAKVTTIGPNQ